MYYIRFTYYYYYYYHNYYYCYYYYYYYKLTVITRSPSNAIFATDSF